MSSRTRTLFAHHSLQRRELAQGAHIQSVFDDGRRQLVFIETGWAMKVADTADGRHQILKFLLPGDCARLDVMCTDMVDGNYVECLTACVVSAIDVELARHMFAEQKLDISSLVDDLGLSVADSDCYMVILGTFTAEERLAWMLLHLYHRADTAGLVRDETLAFPVNQSQLASALGLSLVHTNKTLARLRRQGLVIWSSGKLQIPDIDALAKMSRFR